MRFLFIGSNDGTACALHYYTALVRLGHDALPFNPRYFEGSSLGEKLLIRARKAPTPAKVKRVSEQILALCRHNRFDGVMVLAENFLEAETLETIRKECADPPRFFYHSHDNNFVPGILKPRDFDATLRAYDAVFTTKSQNVARYQALGQKNAHYIPSAYEPMVHHPVPLAYSRMGGEFNVTFIGTFDHSRLPFLNQVGWERLHVWGSDWQRWKGYPAQAGRVTARPAYYFEFADVMSRSRIALGLLRAEAEDRHTQRTFEIPACGAFQLANRNEEILSYFTEGKEIACFDSPEELREKVDYYLRHETERQKIAAAGYRRVTQEPHTYVDRVREMVRIVFEEKAQRPTSAPLTERASKNAT